MKRFFHISKALLSTYYAYMLEYRAELLLWALSGSLSIILLGVWTEAAKSGSFALSVQEFAQYFITIFLMRQLTVVWVIWEFEREIVEGKLAFRLLQPLDPVWHHVGSHISERFARLPFVFLLMSLFFILYPTAFWIPSFANFLLFCVVITCAFALQFLIQYTLAMFAFWTEKASSIQEFWFLLHLFLSGAIAPLDVFPPAVRTIALCTPFPYILNFPANILIGRETHVLQGLSVMAVWATGFLIANRWLWRKGLKQFSGMGA
ncbi:MAG: ABC-2 family transporter protein [Synechococcales bacterium]|nr:ABC-2 family transporter protein [Synechococcales bacterium]